MSPTLILVATSTAVAISISVSIIVARRPWPLLLSSSVAARSCTCASRLRCCVLCKIYGVVAIVNCGGLNSFIDCDIATSAHGTAAIRPDHNTDAVATHK